MKTLRTLILALTACLGLLGCESMKYTSFAPFDARFEPVPSSGARYLVLKNTTTKELHNYAVTVIIWNNNNSRMMRHETHRIFGSGALLVPGQEIRLAHQGTTTESAILTSVNRIELTGHSDEGSFRQAWTCSDSYQLQPVTPNQNEGPGSRPKSVADRGE